MVIKLVMMVSGTVNTEVNFQVKQTTPIGKLMKVYSESVGHPIRTIITIKIMILYLFR